MILFRRYRYQMYSAHIIVGSYKNNWNLCWINLFPFLLYFLSILPVAVRIELPIRCSFWRIQICTFWSFFLASLSWYLPRFYVVVEVLVLHSSVWGQVQQNKQQLSAMKRKVGDSGVEEYRPGEPPAKINSRWTNDELLMAVTAVRKYGKT